MKKRDYSKMGTKGALRRWAKVPKRKRSEAMRILATKRWAKQDALRSPEKNNSRG